MDDMSIINELEICVFGMQRSGNHAIIPWIMDNTEGCRVHLNDIRRIDPYIDFNGMTAYGLSCYTCYRKWRGLNRYLLSRKHLHGDLLGSVQDAHCLLDIPRIRRIHKDVLVLSYEDVFLNDPRVHRFLPNAVRYIGQSKRRLRVLILRDPYNHFASLLKYDTAYKSAIKHTSKLYVHMWKQYAREFTGTTSMLEGESLCVNYNRWCESRDYRQQLAQVFGFTTDGQPYNRVSSIGGGSSFQGVVDDARRLAVTERWRAFRDDALYRSLFDEEVVSFGERIFDMRGTDIL
jgi:hypothetical protein